MKKLLVIALTIVIAACICACDSENAPSDNQNSVNDSQNSVDSTQSNMDEHQGTIDSSQGGATNIKDEPIKWTESDYSIEENWQKTLLVYKQWAEHFKNIDTSSDGFRIYPDFETLSNESDGITVIYGPDAYNIQLTSDDSIKEGLDAIVVGNAWQRVYLADPNGAYPWRAAGYDLFPQYSFHYAKHWVYYFEYEDLIVKKL